MDWLNRMNEAVNYIESHLDGVISYDRAAQVACCSTYHFQRMFSYISGVPLSEYIRRRRLTLAALELQTSGIKVIDAALKYGYESPEAFSRAFKGLHGVTPVSARDTGVSLKVFPKIVFSISIKGDAEMNYRIEQKEAFELFGLELKTTVVNGQCFKDIPAFIERSVTDGKAAALVRDAGKEPGAVFDAGVTYAHNPDGSMNYAIACHKPDKAVPPGYVVFSIPRQTWAVFETGWETEHDDKKLHDVWERIYSEWFPTVSYEHANVDYDLEMYFGDRENGCSCEIWIPVVKK
ncbi:MAG: AraC family transcriptional regulator [Defluviitaleaceae bacterium]|nr:AraC family transcriptional regulator [Defluviitaleaceae bacterium]MCL2835748.1 AraC family transcriptional regulator [Defluviitaleaceae bacterium]